MSVLQLLKKFGEKKKKRSAKYNGSLALATLERANVIMLNGSDSLRWLTFLTSDESKLQLKCLQIYQPIH